MNGWFSWANVWAILMEEERKLIAYDAWFHSQFAGSITNGIVRIEIGVPEMQNDANQNIPKNTRN